MANLSGTGFNSDYELGLGDTTTRDVFTTAAADFVFVAACHPNNVVFGRFGLGIDSSGRLFGWGRNDHYQLGLNDTTTRTTPTQIGSSTLWESVSAGVSHVAAIRTDGTLWTWGTNDYGQLGQGTETLPVRVPTQVGTGTNWAAVACGDVVTFAIKDDGTLWSCGANNFGILGIGNPDMIFPLATRLSFVQIGSATNWAKVSAFRYIAAAIRTDGTLWTWGRGTFYGTGLGSTTDRSSPNQVGSDTNWADCAIGPFHGYAVKSNGTAYGWGQGLYGALAQGSGDTTEKTAPTQMGTATNWTHCDAGSGCGFFRNTSNQVYACGVNNTGGLGLDDTTHRYALTLIPDLEFDQVSAGQGTTLAITSSTGVNGTASAPITITVEQKYNATAPISISVAHKNGTASAPVKVNVRSSGAASAAMRISVVDSLETTTWKAAISLDGSDVSARLTGIISVDAEEGAARIAGFTLLPASGAINPVAWTGSAVTIDLVRVIGGVSVPSRMFTGKVDLATYDPITRMVRFAATDDIRHTVAALTTAQIDTLTGGHYAAAVHGDIGDRWDYAVARMESRPASLDAGPHGNLRVTPWTGLTTWRTFTESDILDESVAIDLPRRQDLINSVEISYQYRYHRLRERRSSVGWFGSILGSAPPAGGYPFPTFQAVESAIAGCGWHVISQTYNDAYAYIKVSKPSGAPSGADADWWLYNGGDGISNYSAQLAQRHAQTVTEAYSLTVTAPASIAANGTLPSSLRGALASTWSADEWEADYTLTPDVSTADADYAPDATRSDSDNAIETLLEIAKTRILASHRTASASFAIPCLPELDLIHAVEIDTGTLDCEGKVERVIHQLDLASGEATTQVSVALSGIAAGGIVTETTLAAPAVPDIDDATGDDAWAAEIPHLASLWLGASDAISHTYTDSLMGFIVNAPASFIYYNFTLAEWYSEDNSNYNAAKAFEVTGFRASMPGVASTHRNPITLDQSATYLVDVPEDPITLTA